MKMNYKSETSLKRKIYQNIDFIWDKVLDDGESIINCCAIPDEMYISVWNQICEELEPLIHIYKYEYGYRDEVINNMKPKTNKDI